MQYDHHEFLEDVEVALIDKTQASGATKKRSLRTLCPNGLNLDIDY